MGATATVVRLHPSQPPVLLDDGPSTIALVQREIRRCKMSYKDLAAEVGVCVQTVSKIACGETRRPAMRTCMLILVALGWEVWASEKR